MREIKFRGRTASGEWLHGDLVQRDGQVAILPADGYDSIDCYFVDPETVGQLLGLNHEHGFGIYEGDIVDVFAGEHHHGIWEYQNRFVIEFGWTRSMWEMLNCDQIEIIGNIHDNPELIQEVTSHDQ